MIRIGAVVLNYNNWDATQRCVSSLRLADLPSGYARLHIVLVDNASAVPVPEELRREVDQVLELSSNTGYGAGNNRGLEACFAAACDWILVLNNDTDLESNALVKMSDAQRYLSVEDPVIIAPEIRYGRARDCIWYSGGDLDRGRGRVTHWGVGMPASDFVPPAQPASFVSGCAMFASACTWKTLGGFEEHYFLYWEDAELSVRHLDSGGSLKIIRDAVVYHEVGGGPSYRGPQRADYYYYGSRNRLWLIRFGFGRHSRWRAMLWTLSFTVRTVGYLVLRDRQMIGGKLIRIIAGTTSGLLRRPRGSNSASKGGVGVAIDGPGIT